MSQDKIERVCHYKKLRIGQRGDIYPCCRAPEHTYLGNIFDDDIIQKIKDAEVICECPMYKSIKKTSEDKIELNYIHYETSNVCQASCICCPQNKDKLPREKEHLEKLREIIEHFKPKNITAIGGEILVQEEAFKMLFELHEKYPSMKIHTISNLSVGEKRLKEAEEIFDEITVSFLGFNPVTYKNEMGLNFDVVMKNFEYLYQNKKVNLRPKFLAMPTNLFEIAEFFKWAITLDVDKVYLHNIHEFETVANLKNEYWIKTFNRLEKKLKSIFEENKTLIQNKNRHFISIHPILAEMTHINSDYIEKNGFEKTVFITK